MRGISSVVWRLNFLIAYAARFVSVAFSDESMSDPVLTRQTLPGDAHVDSVARGVGLRDLFDWIRVNSLGSFTLFVAQSLSAAD